MTAVATAIYHDAGGTSGPFTGYYDGTLTLAETPGGVLTGHLQVSASGCHIYNGTPATLVRSDVSGTDDGKHLRLHLITSSYHDNGINCGFGYGWLPPPPAVSYSSTTAVIPITAAGAAQARWQVLAKAATGQWTIHYHVDLTCADCRAGG